MASPATLKQLSAALVRRFPQIKLEVVKRYIVFMITTVIVFTSAYYALMDQSIKYTNAVNAEAKRLTRHTGKPAKPRPLPPAGWLYLGTGDVLTMAQEEHDVLSALYFSLSVQSTLGPPHYPPNKAWKLLTAIHILFILAAGILTIA